MLYWIALLPVNFTRLLQEETHKRKTNHKYSVSFNFTLNYILNAMGLSMAMVRVWLTLLDCVKFFILLNKYEMNRKTTCWFVVSLPHCDWSDCKDKKDKSKRKKMIFYWNGKRRISKREQRVKRIVYVLMNIKTSLTISFRDVSLLLNKMPSTTFQSRKRGFHQQTE